MADPKQKSARFSSISRPVPEDRKSETCPVCREDFNSDEPLMVIICPAPGCNFMYHDWGDGDSCWDAVDRCARPGCNGKELDKMRSKRRKDMKNIRYFAKKVSKDEQISESEMLLFAQLLREYPEVELAPAVLKKVLSSVKLRG